MKRILLSVLLVVSVVLIGQVIAEPPVMERERVVPGTSVRGRRLPTKLPSIFVDVSCFIDNKRTPAALIVYDKDTPAEIKRTWSSNGRFELLLVDGKNYDIRAYEVSYEPTGVGWTVIVSGARGGAVRTQSITLSNLSTSTAIPLHLTFHRL